MTAVLRIIDANVNRAREAMRVMEESARFVLNDAALAGQMKQLRHDLAAAVESIHGLQANRDTPGDVGTQLTTKAEASRASVAEVVIAAGKRLSEALRAVEEYVKTIDGGVAAAVEQLRYRGYELEKKLNAALGSGRSRQWRLCVLVTERLCVGGDWRSVAQAAVEAGADCIQLREKEASDQELLARARWLVGMCRQSGASVVVNDRVDVALLAGADGVHLGQQDLPCAEARRLAGGQLLIGVSTSNLEEARRAVEHGADYLGVGPMFPTTTKHKEVLAGPGYLRAVVAAFADRPHLAIGGIDAGNVAELAAAGAKGVAVSSAVCGAKDPGGVVRAILRTL